MRIGSVSSSSVADEGHRLTGGYHLAEDQQAMRLLKSVTTDAPPVGDLCRNRGVFRGPIFTRIFAESSARGRPYVSPAELERADIRPTRFLSRLHGQLLNDLELHPGMILVTCSGMSLGRAIWAHGAMAGLCASHDLIRIEADPDKVPPGYLYAFLQSRFGRNAIRRHLYGGNIKHIEPHHLAGIPCPRIADELERDIHRRVVQAADLLAEYSNTLRAATERFFQAVGLEDISQDSWHADGPDLGFEHRLGDAHSLRALNFNPRLRALEARIKAGAWRPLGEICVPGTLRRGGRFKRVDAAPEHAYQLIGQKQLFWLRPEGRWVAKSGLGDDVLVEPGTILVPAQGTLGETELFCRAEFAWGPGAELAYSEHILRILADEDVMLRGCLYAFIRSETAFRMLRSIATGTKLQDHHDHYRALLPVPLPDANAQRKVHDLVVSAYSARYRALKAEDEAICLFESAIEEAA